jgi:hypothetical protein
MLNSFRTSAMLKKQRTDQPHSSVPFPIFLFMLPLPPLCLFTYRWNTVFTHYKTPSNTQFKEKTIELLVYMKFLYPVTKKIPSHLYTKALFTYIECLSSDHYTTHERPKKSKNNVEEVLIISKNCILTDYCGLQLYFLRTTLT